jgi:ribonuclease BN (tRNA processing enzyme)
LRIIELEALDGILISHLHADHWTDLPIALHRMAVTNTGQNLPSVPVYGPAEWVERTGIAYQWFSRDDAPYVSHTLADGESYAIGDLDITVAAVQHGMPTFAMRITDGVSTMTYSADTSPCDSLTMLAKDADLFLCEATLPDRITTSISMNPEQAGQMAATANARQLVLTHLLPGTDPGESCAIAAEAFRLDARRVRFEGDFRVRLQVPKPRDTIENRRDAFRLHE